MELRIEELKLPAEISFNFEEIKTEVAEKVEMYKGLVYTEEQIKEAKADKAKLNKFVEALESKRKEIKKECLAPYETFEKKIKEITAIINEPIMLIDKQLKDYETKQKQAKQEEILAYFNEVNLNEWLDVELIWDSRWLNASLSMAKVKSEIDDKLSKIRTELQILAQLPDYSFEAIEVYKTCLDMLKATNEAQRMTAIAKAKEEEARRKAEEEMKAEAPVLEQEQPVIEEAPQPVKTFGADEVKKYWISFRAYMTVEDAKALKEFFEARGIEYKATRES